MPLSTALREWRDRGRIVQALGMNVFVVHANPLARATPLLLLHGVRDPVAVLDIAEKLERETPGAKLVRLDDLGHYPQLEAPARVTTAVARFVGEIDAG